MRRVRPHRFSDEDRVVIGPSSNYYWLGMFVALLPVRCTRLTYVLRCGILLLVGKIVGIGVLRSEVFDGAPKLSGFKSKETFANLFLQHYCSVFPSAQAFHSRGHQSLVVEVGIVRYRVCLLFFFRGDVLLNAIQLGRWNFQEVLFQIVHPSAQMVGVLSSHVAQINTIFDGVDLIPCHLFPVAESFAFLLTIFDHRCDRLTSRQIGNAFTDDTPGPLRVLSSTVDILGIAFYFSNMLLSLGLHLLTVAQLCL